MRLKIASLLGLLSKTNGFSPDCVVDDVINTLGNESKLKSSAQVVFSNSLSNSFILLFVFLFVFRVPSGFGSAAGHLAGCWNPATRKPCSQTEARRSGLQGESSIKPL